jgi:hypothetical protein
MNPSHDPELEAAARSDGLGPIIDIIGLRKAMELFRVRKGRVAYIPKPENLKQGHWIVEAIGSKAASDLALHNGGNTIAIPNGVSINKVIRDREIVAMRLKGVPMIEVAKAFDISARTVREATKHMHLPKEGVAQFHAKPAPCAFKFSPHVIKFIASRLGTNERRLALILNPQTEQESRTPADSESQETFNF